MEIETPLLLSKFLSACISHKVYLKLENVQPCNSFKVRGIARVCRQKVADGCKGFVTFSGGNAGLALAHVASSMELPCHVCVPSFVSNRVLQRLRLYNADITVFDTGREAYDECIRVTNEDSTLAFIHPYDDPVLWSGYSKIIEEIKSQLDGVKPACLVVSVGGGGLLMGLLTGLKATGWADIPVLAMETIGAHSFNKSLQAGKPIENVVTSIAKTLGAPFIAKDLLEFVKGFNVMSEILSDADAVQACLQFADHHAYLVEPACGVSLATVYKNLLPGYLRKRNIDLTEQDGPVVVIVCGGSDTSVQILQEYASRLGLGS